MPDEQLQSLLNKAESIEIDSAANPIPVKTVSAGQRFVCWYLWLQAEGAGSLQPQSGSTDIGGPINFAANENIPFANAPLPVFVGRATGDDFQIANPSTVQVNGTALVSVGALKT